LLAYQEAGFEIMVVSGDGPAKAQELDQRIAQWLEDQRERHLVIVSADPILDPLCRRILESQAITLLVWTPGNDTSVESVLPAHRHQSLEELLPEPNQLKL